MRASSSSASKSYGLITERVPQIPQGADDPIIPPGPILLGQAYDQGLQLPVDLRVAWSLVLLGAVEFLGDEPAVPGKNRFGFDDRRHLVQRLLPQVLADLSSVWRSWSPNRTQPGICCRRMRCSVIKYS
jgi:hypothetical protein